MEKEYRALVVDDNPQDRKLVRDYLITNGYKVFEAGDGHTAVEMFREQSPDIVILDFMLPDTVGPEVCKQMKLNKKTVPILILSVRGDVNHKVQAFRSGCDDYLNKPCELEELEIRLQNLLKRSKQVDNAFEIGQLKVNLESRKVTYQGKSIDLTVKEFSILEYLVRNANKVLTRSMILEHVWGNDSASFTNIVDVYINYLRKKLGPSSAESYIKTVRGIGYMIEAPSEKRKVA